MQELNFITIGKKIRFRRRQLKLTQEYVANMLDVNPSHVSNIECGRANPSLTALVHIADILHCSVDCFLNSEYDYAENSEESENGVEEGNIIGKNAKKRADVNDSQTEIIDSLDKRIMVKLKNRDDGFKRKILKIIDII